MGTGVQLYLCLLEPLFYRSLHFLLLRTLRYKACLSTLFPAGDSPILPTFLTQCCMANS